MVEKGRRPGKRDTRAEILSAAAAVFAESGFEGTSMRAVATRAGVDPALVHHYFPAGKAALFQAAVSAAEEPRLILDVVFADDHTARVASSPGTKGEAIVATFIRMWDEADRSGGVDAFVSFTQAAASSPEAAAGVRAFLAERIWSKLGDGGRDPDELARRRSLIASQLMGLGLARYLLHLEPVASASPDELARWVGPTIDRYADGDLT